MEQQTIYTGSGQFVMRSLAAAELAPNEVAINVAYTGICGTDLHVFHGEMDARVGTEAVLGHEMSGVVDATGPEVTGLARGDRVTVMPLKWCGTCGACRRGHQYVCRNLRFRGLDLPGAMQSRWVVPSDLVLRLPQDLPLSHAALVEPCAVAVHDVDRAGVEPGDRVLVVGGGPIGMLIALVARRRNADVVLVEIDQFRRDRAARYGLTTLDPQSTDVAAFVTEWCAGEGADVSFEVSGTEAGLAYAVENLRVHGRICLVAVHVAPPHINAHRIFWQELTLVGARLYVRKDFERAIDLVADPEFGAEQMITHRFPIADISQAFGVLERRADAIKVLVQCTAGLD